MRAERILQLMAAVGLTACVAGRAHAYCRLTTAMPVAGAACSDTGIPLLWSRQCISYSVVPRTQANPTLTQIRDVVDRAFGAWNEISCNGKPIPISLAQSGELSMCDRAQYNETAPNANSIIFVSDWAARSLPPEAFGLTLVWHDSKTGEIVDADMQLNETIGPLTICGRTCGSGQVDLQNIITHEAGHFLGLGHSSQTSACMYGRAAVGETSKRFLTRDDQAGLCSMYGDLAAATCTADDYVPDNGFSGQCNTAASSSGCSCQVLGAQQRDRKASFGLRTMLLSALALLTGLATWQTRRRKRARQASH